MVNHFVELLIAALLLLGPAPRAAAQVVRTLAGGGAGGGTLGGSSNGDAVTAARYNMPCGVAVDPATGNVYIADTGNHKLRLIFPNLTVVTLAGGNTTGTASGFLNGVGTAALFNQPYGVAVDASGNVIVADSSNHCIRKVTPGGAVSTLAGSGSAMFADGTGTNAAFFNPYGVAVNTSGGVIVADTNNHKIRLIDPINFAVTTLAGGSSSGSSNGLGTAALFNQPNGVAVDTASGNVVVVDTSNHKVRLIFSNLTVITLVGGGSLGTSSGATNGFGTNALFILPRGVDVDPSSGNVCKFPRAHTKNPYQT